MSAADSTYDVIVIGAGPVGENVADRAHRGGLSVCIVEKHLVGGECSHYACVPSKALLRPVHLTHASRRVRGIVPARLDPAGVLARRDDKTGGGDDAGGVEWLSSVGIDLVRGEGRLAGERSVRVDMTGNGNGATERNLSARHAVVLAVGTTAGLAPIDGLRAAQPWTNREATTSATVPGRLAVLGGGVVGAEMAQAYRGLGATVTLIHRGERLLERAEAFAGDLVAGGLRADGVDVRLRTNATKVDRADDGTVTIELDDGSVVQADEVLAALGRRPATGELGLETVGLEPGGYVDVDDTLQATGVEAGWLYATGDVNGRNLLTHMGKYQGRVCGDVIAARAAGEPIDAPSYAALADRIGAPQVVFTDPEVAAVGYTAAAAREKGFEVDVVDVDMGSAAGAGLLADDYVGAARLVVDRQRRVVLGATFVGQDTAEMLHAATIAVVGEVPIDRLWHAVPAFPTVSEVWLRLLESYGL